MEQIVLYDTTLRDGTQGENISFSAKEKIQIAKSLDDFGIHYIEGGWPGSNPRDMEFFDLAQKKKFVITSYSIHYTKLYELRPRPRHLTKRQPGAGPVV